MFAPKFIKLYASEKEYRADKSAYNFSLLKDFSKKSLRGFKKKYIDLDNSDDEDNKGMEVGKLVHAKLADLEDDFLDNFHLSTLNKVPKPQEKRFVDELFKLTLENTDEEGVFTADFGEICQKAYTAAEISSPLYNNFIPKFEGGDMEEYYKELRNGIGKQLVTLKDIDLMERVIDRARKSKKAGEVLNHKDCLNEVPILFEYEGIRFRCLIDRLNFFHSESLISPYDWKVTYATGEKEFDYNYFDMGYYLQQFLYGLAVIAYTAEFHPSYKVDPFRYVAIDNLGLYESLVHEFEFPTPGENPWFGFTHKNRKYRGIAELIDSLEWHKANNQWSMKKSTFDSGGYCKHVIGS